MPYDIEQMDGCRTAPDDEGGLYVTYTEALDRDVIMVECWWLGCMSQFAVRAAQAM
jgi:hypothetical protein